MEPDFSALQNQRLNGNNNSQEDQIVEKRGPDDKKKEVKKAKKKVTSREFFSSHDNNWLPEKEPRSGGLAMMGLDAEGKQIMKMTKVQENRQK